MNGADLFLMNWRAMEGIGENRVGRDGLVCCPSVVRNINELCLATDNGHLKLKSRNAGTKSATWPSESQTAGSSAGSTWRSL